MDARVKVSIEISHIKHMNCCCKSKGLHDTFWTISVLSLCAIVSLTHASTAYSYYSALFTFYLELDHGAEVVIPEKNTELSLLYSRCELT